MDLTNKKIGKDTYTISQGFKSGVIVYKNEKPISEEISLNKAFDMLEKIYKKNTKK